MLTTKINHHHKSQSIGFLCWDKGGHSEQREVKKLLSIGREDTNLLVLEDNCVSRHHARIERKEDSGFFILKDMNSRNGVFLNGNRIYQAVLSHNDKIQIGNLTFTFSFEKYNHKWQLSTQSLNEKWNQQLNRIPHLAQTDCPILILGPSGTGKEIIAQIIHKLSPRNKLPLVSVNCSALTETLVESELFGHTKGSYTGAIQDRKGAFIAANRGTLFLDEIGDLPLKLQPKFLRAIEYQEIKPVGSDITLKTNVRIISATHQDLKNKSEENEFRKDLYYRLNVVTISIPALKDRMEDFEPLLHSFTLKEGVTFSTKAINILKNYHWPGNIRELKNTVSRAKALFTNETIDEEKAAFILDQGEKEQKTFMTLKGLEKTAITTSLKRFNGNQSKAATALDIPRSTLHDRIQEYGINVKQFKDSSKLSP